MSCVLWVKEKILKMYVIACRLAILFTPLFALAFVSIAFAEEVSRIDRFQLWNNCRPVDLTIESSNSEKITIAVRSKLRAARLYDAEASTWLLIREYSSGLVSGISVQYHKALTDTVSGESAWMVTWSRNSEGVLVGVGFAQEWVSQLTDEFIDEYLRVNADVCRAD